MRARTLAVLAALTVVAAPAARAERPRVDPDAAIQLMIEASLEVSRTKASGRRFLAPDAVGDAEIPALAERNFRAAAGLIAHQAGELAIDRATAIQLNRIVTNGLVPEATRGDPYFRLGSTYARVTDSFVAGDVTRFYDWLEGDGRRLGERDPIALAEAIHYNMSALDSFPDGNGRTARLMADLVLLKHGLAPALYTSKDDYFARGNPRSASSRADQRAYFAAIAKSGQKRLALRAARAGKRGAAGVMAPRGPAPTAWTRRARPSVRRPGVVRRVLDRLRVTGRRN